MKRYGVDWKQTDPRRRDAWVAACTTRVRAHVQPFGIEHKVFLPEVQIDAYGETHSVDLVAQNTRDHAMKHALTWAQRYVANGPPSVDAVLSDLYKRFPRTYRTRLDVIDRLFFYSSNGEFRWVSGALLSMQPEAQTVSPLAPNEIGPVPDDGKPRAFSTVDDCSNISRVPDDAKAGWIRFAYEAALALRDRSDTNAFFSDSQVARGDSLVADLESRFYWLKLPTWLQPA